MFSLISIDPVSSYLFFLVSDKKNCPFFFKKSPIFRCLLLEVTTCRKFPHPYHCPIFRQKVHRNLSSSRLRPLLAHSHTTSCLQNTFIHHLTWRSPECPNRSSWAIQMRDRYSRNSPSRPFSCHREVPESRGGRRPRSVS